MDLKKLRTGNSSSLSLSSIGRQSSVESNASSTKASSTRKKLSRLLPGRRSRRGSVAVDIRSGTKDESASSTPLRTSRVDPKDLNLVDSGDEQVVTLEDDEQFSHISPARPDLSSHPSHAGFATLSSPLIPVKTIPVSSPAKPATTASTEKSSRSAAQATTQDNTPPSPSPAGRQRDALASSIRSGSPAGSLSASAGSIRPGGAGVSRIGTLFGGRARKPGDNRLLGLESDEALTLRSDEKPNSQEPIEVWTAPKKAVPAIRTLLANQADSKAGFQTLVTPPTPVDIHSDSETGSFAGKLSRRRSSASEADLPSDLPSRKPKSSLNPTKLFQSFNPLTPAEEEVKTPGGSLTTPSASGGFFSSVFSVAQNAATTLSNSITVGSKNKSSLSLTEAGDAGGEEVILSNKSVSSDADSKSERSKKPAVETLGLGNLSLTHLGIVDSKNPSPNASQFNLMDTTNNTSVAAAEAIAKHEDSAASKAISKAYEKTNGDKLSASPEATRTVVADDADIHQSIEDGASMRRAGSVRSKMSGKRRRTRGSSLNTNGGVQSARFTAAPAKRNRDFHNAFKSVPEDDQLIEDYAAALQKEILLQGRLYISEGHVCFSSNIFGYVTTLIISFDEIIAVEKRNTAMIFANGISIQTMHARHVLASLLLRDATYELIVSIWKVTNPNLRSTLNGAAIEGGGTGDKTEKVGDADDDSASEEVYDEDDEGDEESHEEGDSFEEAVDHSAATSEVGDAVKQNRKVSNNVAAGFSASGPKNPEALEAAAAGAGAKNDFPGPSTHDPTDCADQSTHYDKLLLDATIPAPLGKVYNLLFGAASPQFMRTFLESEKTTNFLSEENDAGLSLEAKTRKFQYVRPLSGPIGPKQTRCIISETLEQVDFEKAVSVSCSTSNPDVPSGGSFQVKTRYCMMWAPGNATRMLITYTVVWSGRSLIKGAVESGVASGQLAYAKALASFVSAAAGKGVKTKGTKKGGRRKRSADSTVSPAPTFTSNAASEASSWGIFEPIKPIFDILGALAPPSSLVIGILIATVLALLLRSPAANSPGKHRLPGIHHQHGSPSYYENVWRNEESELWNWIEERVGLWEAMKTAPDEIFAKAHKKQKQRAGVDELDGLGEQEVLEAIKVTKERLDRLEQTVEERRKTRKTSD